MFTLYWVIYIHLFYYLLSVGVVHCFLFLQLYWFLYLFTFFPVKFPPPPPSSTQNSINTPLQICIIFLLFIIFFIVCGHGDLFLQDGDWNKHHAIYYDLMNYHWPVIYQDDTMLTYYIGQYIVPAFLAKLCFHSTIILRCAIVLWNALGLLLVYLYLSEHYQLKKLFNKCLLLLFLLFFGGCFIIGNFIYHLPSFEWIPQSLKWIDLANIKVHFAPTFDALRGAFQHVLTPWLGCCLFLEYNKKYNAYLLFLLPMIFSATFGAVYFFILLFAYVIIEMIRTRKFFLILKKLFGKVNLCLLPMTLIICIYLLGNITGEKPSTTGISFINMFAHPKFYLIFTLCEFGLYYLILIKSHARNPIFWITWAELMIIPFISIGIFNDFCSRGSIPLRFFLMLYCFEHINSFGLKNLRSIFIAAVFSCTLLITGYQILSQCHPVSNSSQLSDSYKTFEGSAGNSEIRQDNAYNYYTFHVSKSLFGKILNKR